MMYAQESDAMSKLRDPIQVHVGLPDMETPLMVYVEQLAFHDMRDLAQEADIEESAEEGSEQDDDPTQNSSGSVSRNTVYIANNSEGAPSAAMIPVLMQRHAGDDDSQFVLQMDEQTFNQLTGQAERFEETAQPPNIDIDSLAREIYSVVKGKMEQERERSQPLR